MKVTLRGIRFTLGNDHIADFLAAKTASDKEAAKDKVFDEVVYKAPVYQELLDAKVDPETAALLSGKIKALFRERLEKLL